MTGGSADKAMEQLLAAINQGKDLPRRYQPSVALGFPDLDVFTPEALERIKALAGGDPVRTARLSARVLKIARRECAVPVLPDLVDDAAAQIDLERAGADDAQPDDEHSAPRTDHLPLAPQGMPLPEPSARHDPGPQTAGPQSTGPQSAGPQSGTHQISRAAPSVSVPRRRARRIGALLGVLLIMAAGTAGYLAYSGRLDAFGGTREIVASTLAAIGVAPPGGEQQQDNSGDSGGSSPAGGTAGSELPTGPSGEAAIAEDDRQDETANETSAAGDPLREDDRSQDDRRAEGATSAERWLAERRPELEEADETAIKQRVREVSEEAEKARQSLEAIGLELEQLHRRLHDEMQARHARELSQAEAEGADAVAQAKDRHQQERAVLQRDWDADREFLAAAHNELDQQLQNARHALARAREEAAAAGQGESGEPRALSGLPAHEQPAVSLPAAPVPAEDSTAADPVAAETGLQPQTDDRHQQNTTMLPGSGPESGVDSGAEASADPDAEPGQASGEDADETPVMAASGQTEPPQDKASEPAAPQMAEPPTDEEAAPKAEQPPPAVEPSPPAEPVPVVADGATAPQVAQAAAAPESEPATDEEAASNAGQPPPTVEPSPPAEPVPVAVDRTTAPQVAQAAAAPESEPATEPYPAEAPAGQDVANLINRGNALLDLGDLASARLFYQLAANRGSPEGAMRMGMTFDPVYFARTGIQGTQPQIQDALHWYDKAIVMGSQPAERRMAELRSWLEQSAAAGNARAKAALQQPR